MPAKLGQETWLNPSIFRHKFASGKNAGIKKTQGLWYQLLPMIHTYKFHTRMVHVCMYERGNALLKRSANSNLYLPARIWGSLWWWGMFFVNHVFVYLPHKAWERERERDGWIPIKVILNAIWYVGFSFWLIQVLLYRRQW